MTATMATVCAAALAAASVACLVHLPHPGEVRLAALRSPVPSSYAAPPFWLGAGLLATPVLLLLGPVVASLVLIALLVVRGVRERRRRAGARRDERRRAVEACGALAGELRAGRSPAAALAVAAELASGPSRQALRTAASAAQIGGDVAGSLLAMGAPSESGGRSSSALGSPAASPAAAPTAAVTAVPEVLRALAACWTVCAASGSGLASSVDRLEEGLRAEQERRRAIEAELAGPRATAGMLAVLPLAGLLLATGLGADPAQVLLHTPLGLACLVGGLIFDGLGLLWTGRLVDRAGGSD